MDNDIPAAFEMPGEAFEFEDVTSVFEKAGAGTLLRDLMCDA